MSDSRHNLRLLCLISIVAASGCAVHRLPVSIAKCWRDVRYAHRDIEYSFVLRNVSGKEIAGVRAGFATIGSQSATGIGHFVIYDYVRPLRPGESHAVSLYSSPFLGARYYRSGEIDCEVESVQFADGSQWFVTPGVAPPDMTQHGPL